MFPSTAGWSWALNERIFSTAVGLKIEKKDRNFLARYRTYFNTGPPNSMSVTANTTYMASFPKRPNITEAPDQVFKFNNFLDCLIGGIKDNTISAIGIINLLGRCRHCSGNYEARGASGGKYEARIVIFRILATVDRFSWISRKAESR